MSISMLEVIRKTGLSPAQVLDRIGMDDWWGIREDGYKDTPTREDILANPGIVTLLDADSVEDVLKMHGRSRVHALGNAARGAVGDTARGAARGAMRAANIETDRLLGRIRDAALADAATARANSDQIREQQAKEDREQGGHWNENDVWVDASGYVDSSKARPGSKQEARSFPDKANKLGIRTRTYAKLKARGFSDEDIRKAIKPAIDQNQHVSRDEAIKKYFGI